MSLKENPTGVAVTAIVATLTFCVTVIIPIWDKEKDNRIAELAVEPSRLKTEIADLSAQIQTVEAENQKLRRDLDQLSPDALFYTNEVYPRGYRQIRIGDRISLLEKVYAARATVEDEESWVSVRLTKPDLFSQITYYYDSEGSNKTVTHVLFHLAEPEEEKFSALKRALIDKFGQQNMKERRSKIRGAEVYWDKVAGGYDIALRTTNYHVSKR